MRISLNPLKILLATGLCFLSLSSVGIYAQTEAPPIADDPVLENRVKEIAQELRCLVCQNETIAASHADLAIDLRHQIRDKLVQHQTKQEIIDYMVDRYGDFILYKPPLKPRTWILWLSPFLLLIVGFYLLREQIRSLKNRPTQTLSEQDKLRAQALLKPPIPNSQTQKDLR